jgi:hypothetical protein
VTVKQSFIAGLINLSKISSTPVNPATTPAMAISQHDATLMNRKGGSAQSSC